MGEKRVAELRMIEVDVVGSWGRSASRRHLREGRDHRALRPSGSGKSLTLNLIAGLLRPDRGFIAVDGRVLSMSQNGIFEPTHRRRIGLVFQESNLFPHMSVKQNLLYGRWFAPATRVRSSSTRSSTR